MVPLIQKFIFLIAISLLNPSLYSYDLTIVGPVTHSDGIGRISVGLIDLLKDELKINCIPTYLNTTDLSSEVNEVASHHDKTPGTVSILFNGLWHMHINPPLYVNTPNSKIKIAYSMLESSRIPSEWVQILNSFFDAVVVPDSFLVDVYKNSGVTIPIFELPIGMYLDEFFQKPKLSRVGKPFIFGTTVSCDERKNFSLLIHSFAEEFGNHKDVYLKLNSRQGDAQFYVDLIRSLGISNIIFTHNILEKGQYIDFLNSFDCFINISKGEGFSLCPREALALGIPCILTRNSAQITICDTGLVREVSSLIPEPATYSGAFGNLPIGDFFNCTKLDVREALRDVYTNYAYYQEKAKTGPKWVSKYNWNNLKNKYLNLIKPKVIYLGNRNEINDEYLMTNSRKLYKKYKKTFEM